MKKSKNLVKSWASLTTVKFKINSDYSFELFITMALLVLFDLILSLFSVVSLQRMKLFGKTSFFIGVKGFVEQGLLFSNVLFFLIGVSAIVSFLVLVSRNDTSGLIILISLTFAVSNAILASTFLPLYLSYLFYWSTLPFPPSNFWSILRNLVLIGFFFFTLLSNHVPMLKSVKKINFVFFSAWIGAVAAYTNFFLVIGLGIIFLVFDLTLIRGFFGEFIKTQHVPDHLEAKEAIVSIGLGDLVFYSLTTSSVWIFFKNLSFIASIAVSVGILTGLIYTLVLLSKVEGETKVLPGIPLPIINVLLITAILCVITYLC